MSNPYHPFPWCSVNLILIIDTLNISHFSGKSKYNVDICSKLNNTYVSNKIWKLKKQLWKLVKHYKKKNEKLYRFVISSLLIRGVNSLNCATECQHLCVSISNLKLPTQTLNKTRLRYLFMHGLPQLHCLYPCSGSQ